MLISLYIPHWEDAVGPLLLQLLLIGILWAAMFAYSRRWGARVTAIVLTFGVLAPTVAILGLETYYGLGDYGDACREFSGQHYIDAFLIIIRFIELWDFGSGSRKWSQCGSPKWNRPPDGVAEGVAVDWE